MSSRSGGRRSGASRNQVEMATENEAAKRLRAEQRALISQSPLAPDTDAVVLLAHKPVPIGLIARCLSEQITRVRSGFWANDHDLIVTFPDRALVCHPVKRSQLEVLCGDAEVGEAVDGWLVEDQGEFQVWLEQSDSQSRVIHPSATAALATLKLLTA